MAQNRDLKLATPLEQKSEDKKPDWKSEITISKADAGFLGVDVEEDPLVPDLALGGEADEAPDVRVHRRAGSRRLCRHGCLLTLLLLGYFSSISMSFQWSSLRLISWIYCGFHLGKNFN